MRRLALLLPILTLTVVGCFGQGGGPGSEAGDGSGSSIGLQNSGDASGAITIAGSVTMGPMCAVVTAQSCPDAILEGAKLVLVDSAGAEIDRAVSDREGRFNLSLLAGDGCTLVPQPVEGLVTPGPVSVEENEERASVVLRYDTGLR